MASLTLPRQDIQRPSRLTLLLGYLRRNKSLAIGLIILLGLVLFTVVGMLTVDTSNAYPLSVKSKQPPSLAFPFGTDFFGRDLLAAMVVGMWQTALIGVMAGGLGVFIGIILGFISAYFGGVLDIVIKGICQILTPIPAVLIQIIIAGSLDRRDVTIFTMALVVTLLQQRHLFAQRKNVILPVALGIKPWKAHFKGGVFPTARQPSSVVNNAQRAERLHQMQFQRVKIIELVITFHNVHELSVHGSPFTRQ